MAKLSTSNILLRRNLIVNGDIKVNQYNATGSQTGIGAGDNGIHVADRWRWREQGAPDGIGTHSKNSDTPAGAGLHSSYKVNVTTSQTENVDVSLNTEQRVVGKKMRRVHYGSADAQDMAYGIWIKSTVTTGTMCLWLHNNDADWSYVHEITIADNNWNYYSFIIPGDTVNSMNTLEELSLRVGLCMYSGSTWETGTTDTWITGDFTSTANQTNFHTDVNNVYFSGVQLEVGSVATEFEQRTIQEEMAECQSYYWKMMRETTGATITRGMAGYCDLTTKAVIAVPFPTTMRSIPTLVYGNANDIRLFVAGVNITGSAMAIANASNYGCEINVTAVGLAAGEGCTGCVYGSGAWIAFNAEI